MKRRVLALAIYVPPAAAAFRFVSATPENVAVAIVAAGAAFLPIELLKLARYVTSGPGDPALSSAPEGLGA